METTALGTPSVPPKSQVTARQRYWLGKRCTVGRKRASWRPLKTYRTSAKRFLRNMDNQFRVLTGKGLVQFQHDPDAEVWTPQNWRLWPWLGLALDQGPDNICGVMALIYKFFVNCDLMADPAHGANRDVWLASLLCLGY